MSDSKINNPFLNLLKEDNLNKIKIDKELIPAFKIVISKISDYFLQKGLMETKDWNSFFNNFLLTDNSEQVCIKLGLIGEGKEPIAGQYNKEKKIIAIESSNNIKYLCSNLCHEFIHFLVMHDSNSLSAKVSDSSFFNEGLTELLTMRVMNGDNKFSTYSSYFKEIEMAEFYLKITNNAFFYFLNDRFAFEDTEYAPSNLIRSSNKFQEDNKVDSYLSIQREIILDGLKDYNINSFEDFVEIVTIINQRPKFDGEFINYLFEKIVDKYIEKLYLNEQDVISMKDKLMKFCKISNKYQLYGDNGVQEYLIDDLHIAFDKKGEHYNDFPLDGINKSGQVMTSMYHNRIEVTHRDKKYIIDTTKMKFRNWKPIYDSYLEKISKEIKSQNVSSKVK